MSVTIDGSTGITLPDSGALSTSIGDAINITSGYVSGIQLGGTAAANDLDDYEEGTWTPTVNSASGSLFKNSYIKIGKQVTVTAFFSSVSWNAGLNTVDNLPFSNGYGSASGFSATDTVVIQQATVDGTQIKFRAATSGTNKYLMFAATYILD